VGLALLLEVVVVTEPFDHPFVRLEDFDTVPAEWDEGAPESNGHGDPEAIAPFALELDAFLAVEDEDVPALFGTDEETIIPRGGLVIVAGKPSIGKTTFMLDGVFHLASGMEWLGVPCRQGLRVLIVENEGPARMFRKKLAHKRALWKPELTGGVFVQTWRWGNFSIAESDARAQLAGFLEEHSIDLVVGDPLTTLGTEGVGSPEDTRKFTAMLVELGLFNDRAFMFLHHFRKEPTADEIDSLSGSWGGHLDSLLLLKATPRDVEARLSFPKLRWANAPKKPLILGRVYNTASFEVLGEEGDPALIEPAVLEALADGVWKSPTDIAKAASKNRKAVEECLSGNSHLFVSRPGSDVGRPRVKVAWSLRDNEPEPPEPEAQTHLSLVEEPSE
jgi:hypothetical protein